MKFRKGPSTTAALEGSEEVIPKSIEETYSSFNKVMGKYQKIRMKPSGDGALSPTSLPVITDMPILDSDDLL